MYLETVLSSYDDRNYEDPARWAMDRHLCRQRASLHPKCCVLT